MNNQPIYDLFTEIAEIEDRNIRKQTLREYCFKDNRIAVLLQRCYHPDYKLDLPLGEIPDHFLQHDYNFNMKRFSKDILETLGHWGNWVVGVEYPRHLKENEFIALYLGLDNNQLLIAVKDKKLPWKNLSYDFIRFALPEIFENVYNTDGQFGKNRPKEYASDTIIDEDIEKVQNQIIAEIKGYSSNEISEASPKRKKRGRNLFDPETMSGKARIFIRDNQHLDKKAILKAMDEIGLATPQKYAIYKEFIENAELYSKE